MGKNVWIIGGIALAAYLILKKSGGLGSFGAFPDELEQYRIELVNYGLQNGIVSRVGGCTKRNFSPKSNLRNCRFNPGPSFEDAARHVANQGGAWAPPLGR